MKHNYIVDSKGYLVIEFIYAVPQKSQIEIYLNKDILANILRVSDLSTFIRFRFLSCRINDIIIDLLKQNQDYILNKCFNKLNTKFEGEYKIPSVTMSSTKQYNFDALSESRQFETWKLRGEFIFMSYFYHYYNENQFHIMIKIWLTLLDVVLHEKNREVLFRHMYRLFAKNPQFLMNHLQFYSQVIDRSIYLIAFHNMYMYDHIDEIIKSTCSSKYHRDIFLEILRKYRKYSRWAIVKEKNKQFTLIMNQIRKKVERCPIKSETNQIEINNLFVDKRIKFL
jgi:hypothetical protein